MFVRLLLSLGCLLPAAGAHAYVLKQTETGKSVRWAEMPVRFKVSGAGARDLSRAEARQAVAQAFAPWTRVDGAAVVFVDEGETDRPVGFKPGAVNQNVIAWSRDAWPFEPDALAMTVTAYQQNSGRLVDADILVNEDDYSWGVGKDAENDLVNALTHEVGHFLGLAHSTNPEATMFARAEPFETEKRSLHADDAAGLSRLYPGQRTTTIAPSVKADAPASAPPPGAVETQATAATPAAPRVKITTGCAQAPVGGTGFGSIGLLGLALLRRRRAARNRS